MIKNQSHSIVKEQEAWSLLYGRPVSEEEFRQIAGNLDGFFNTLLAWQNAEAEKEKKSAERNIDDYGSRNTFPTPIP